MVNNLNDGLAWGLFPILFATAGLSVAKIGVLAAVYPAVWGLGQLVTGPLSDRWGRKHLITAGMLLQAAALALVALAGTFTVWLVAAVLLGAGTAMVYPTLLATIGDVAHPAWRASAVPWKKPPACSFSSLRSIACRAKTGNGHSAKSTS